MRTEQHNFYVLHVHILTCTTLLLLLLLLHVSAKLCGHHINVYYVSLKTNNTERMEMKVGRYCHIRLPPHSSIMAVSWWTWSPAIFSMLLMPSKTTLITCVSLQFRRLQKGGITPSWISSATCLVVPLIVRLLIAHAASFCVWNSPYQHK